MRQGISGKLLSRAISMVAVATLALSGSLLAQGITTGAVRGKVIDEAGNPVVGAVLTLTNTQTGLHYTVPSREDGRYNVENVTPGGPFTLTARAIGYRPAAQTGIRVSLGQVVEANLSLTAATVELSALTVTAEAENPLTSTSRTGAASYVADSSLRRLPSLNRDFTDFIRTVPQVVGSNFVGQNSKFNNIQIDGGVNNDLFGLSGGAPGGSVNATAISLEAVKEYQVLIAPFDVRQGGFTGGLVNAVTKSGTNEFHGSLFGFLQNENWIGVDTANKGFSTFRQNTWGFSLAGPILRDRLQFMVVGEFKGYQAPFSTVNIGPDPTGGKDSIGVGITQATANKIRQYAITNLGFDPGDYTAPLERNPDNNFVVKLNSQIAANHQLELTYNTVKASDNKLIRSPTLQTTGSNAFRDGYELSNSGYSITNTTNTTRLRWNGSFGRFTNEALAGYSRIRDNRPQATPGPQLFIGGDRAGQYVAIGGEKYSSGNSLNQDIYELTDNLTFVRGRHLFTVGTHNEFFKFHNVFFNGSMGVWAFQNYDSLVAKHPFHYEIALPGALRPDGPIADFSVNQYGLYAQDIWSATPKLSITVGVRLDDPVMNKKPAFNPTLSDSLGVNSSQFSTAALWSPRLGFNYDLKGDQSTLIRGGIGVFSGRPPYVWVSNAYANTGMEQALLKCDGAQVPTFTDSFPQPKTCGGGGTAVAPIPHVVYFDKSFKFPQTMRISLGADHQLPWNVVGTFDYLYTRTLNQFFLNDVNLATPTATSAGEAGRTLYGTFPTIAGRFTPTANRRSAQFLDVIRQSNVSGDNSSSFTVQLNKRFSDRIEFNAGYTYSKTRDRISMTSSISNSNLSFATLDGTLANRPLRTSVFDVPHNIVLSMTVDVMQNLKASLIYNGHSGTPYTYVYNGDVNADGMAANDIVYVPKNPSDITLATRGDSVALFNYINAEPCLKNAMGAIMQRNTCRNPWQNFLNGRLSAVVPTVRGQSLELTMDIFNLLSFLKQSWGIVRQTSGFEGLTLLRMTGYDAVNGRGIYSLSLPQKNVISPISSRWRMEFSARYTF